MKLKLNFLKKLSFRAVSLILLLLIISNAFGQKKLSLFGSISDYGTKTDICGSEIIIYENGIILDNILSDRKGRFSLNIDLGSKYILSFNKPGFIPKCIEVDTRGAENSENPFSMVWEIDLIYSFEQDSLSISPMLIGRSYYDSNRDDLVWDHKMIEKFASVNRSNTDRLIENYIMLKPNNKIVDISKSCESKSELSNGLEESMHKFCLNYFQIDIEKEFSELPDSVLINEVGFTFEECLVHGDSLISIGEIEGAIIHYEKMLFRFPENSLIRKKLKRLAKESEGAED